MIYIILIYLLSTLRMYFWFKNAFSYNGSFKHSNADLGAFMFTFTPIINTISSLLFTLESFNGKEDGEINMNKLFGVKK